MSLSPERLRTLGFLLRDVWSLYAKYFGRHARPISILSFAAV